MVYDDEPSEENNKLERKLRERLDGSALVDSFGECRQIISYDRVKK